MADKIYANGIFFNPPNEKSPDFVLGSISIDIEKFDIELIKKYANGKYVKLDIKQGKERPYIQVDTYKREHKGEKQTAYASPAFSKIQPEDIPF